MSKRSQLICGSCLLAPITLVFTAAVIGLLLFGIYQYPLLCAGLLVLGVMVVLGGLGLTLLQNYVKDN